MQAFLLPSAGSRQYLDMTVGKIENGLKRGFIKRRLNYLLITDPERFRRHRSNRGVLCKLRPTVAIPSLICTNCDTGVSRKGIFRISSLRSFIYRNACRFVATPSQE